MDEIKELITKIELLEKRVEELEDKMMLIDARSNLLLSDSSYYSQDD